MSRSLRVALWVLLLVEVAGVVWLVLNPSPATPTGAISDITEFLRAHGMDRKVARPRYVEFLLNVSLFVPLGLLTALVWPKVPRWMWVAAGVGLSACFELFQHELLDARSASVRDVCSNGLGMALGVGIASGLRALGIRRSGRVADRQR